MTSCLGQLAIRNLSQAWGPRRCQAERKQEGDSEVEVVVVEVEQEEDRAAIVGPTLSS